MIELPLIDNKTILTETGGFLGGGFTHTINIAEGCPYAGGVCGTYCYPQHNPWITKGRPWGLYGFKENAAEPYRRQYDALKRPRRGEPRPLRIFMCSSTDPYPPQKIGRQITRALLQEMRERPPDALVLQTRGPFVVDDLELITELSSRFELWVSITVETDRERLPAPFPNHATPIRKRIEALKAFHERGVLTQATVSPLLPLADTERFAAELGEVSARVILDHYLLGDGSPGGLRTKRTEFPGMLEASGFGEWNELEKFWEVKTTFDRVLGPERVLVSADGFNAIGSAGTPPEPDAGQRTAAGSRGGFGPAGSSGGTGRDEDPPHCHSNGKATSTMSGDLTSGHVEARRKQLLQDLNVRARYIRDFVCGVARSYYPGFYLYGPPGTAKTHTVRGVLEEELQTPYVYRRGHLTPIGLFQLLASSPDDVIVIDDVGFIFAQPVALQIMLAALEQPKKGRTRRITYKRKDHEESFDFRGGLIAISNLQLHDAGLLEAVKSRIHTLKYDPPPAQLAALMLDIASRGYPPGGAAVSAADATEVARHVIGEALRLRSRMDLRLFVDKALPLFVQARDDETETHWKDLVTASIEESLSDTRHEVEPPESRTARIEAETRLAIEIYHALPTHEARVEAWTRKTGKSRRAFYRRLEKAQEGQQ